MWSSKNMQSLLVCTLSLILVSGCATQIALDAWGFKLAVGSSIIDIRISEKLATVDRQGVQTAADKDAMSQQFAHMIEVTLPEIVSQAVRAALLAYGAGALGNYTIPDVPEVMEEVVPE